MPESAAAATIRCLAHPLGIDGPGLGIRLVANLPDRRKIIRSEGFSNVLGNSRLGKSPIAWREAIRHSPSERTAAVGERPLGPRRRMLGGFAVLIARSEEMQALLRLGRLYANGRGPIVLIGRTGTGKGVLARYLHGAGRNPQAPFVIARGPELSTSLGESTLFGHLKGAFTGAIASRKGLVGQAGAGTMFIDEFHLMPQ